MSKKDAQNIVKDLNVMYGLLETYLDKIQDETESFSSKDFAFFSYFAELVQNVCEDIVDFSDTILTEKGCTREGVVFGNEYDMNFILINKED